MNPDDTIERRAHFLAVFDVVTCPEGANPFAVAVQTALARPRRFNPHAGDRLASITTGTETRALRPEPRCTFTNTEERTNSRNYHASQRCRHLRPARDPATGGFTMRACGSTSCSRECRDLWAWKHWMCLVLSFRTRPPTHHVVLTPIGNRAGDTFGRDIGKGMTRMRAALGGVFEYARVFEWSKGRIHAHLLLRVSGSIPRGRVKRAMDRVRPGGYRVSCKPVESVPAIARYFVKSVLCAISLGRSLKNAVKTRGRTQ